MQGFYVYRENRLIHYGDWLGLFINEPHGSLLRVEFSFDHIGERPPVFVICALYVLLVVPGV